MALSRQCSCSACPHLSVVAGSRLRKNRSARVCRVETARRVPAPSTVTVICGCYVCESAALTNGGDSQGTGGSPAGVLRCGICAPRAPPLQSSCRTRRSGKNCRGHRRGRCRSRRSGKCALTGCRRRDCTWGKSTRQGRRHSCCRPAARLAPHHMHCSERSGRRGDSKVSQTAAGGERFTLVRPGQFEIDARNKLRLKYVLTNQCVLLLKIRLFVALNRIVAHAACKELITARR